MEGRLSEDLEPRTDVAGSLDRSWTVEWQERLTAKDLQETLRAVTPILFLEQAQEESRRRQNRVMTPTVGQEEPQSTTLSCDSLNRGSARFKTRAALILVVQTRQEPGSIYPDRKARTASCRFIPGGKPAFHSV